MMGGKGKLIIFAQNGRYEIVALRAIFSLPMLEHLHSRYEHSMYSMISMVLTDIAVVLPHTAVALHVKASFLTNTFHVYPKEHEVYLILRVPTISVIELTTGAQYL
jgi:hypothetical protein